MSKIDIKLNHKGSTLLIVIICIAFIGILGSLMLSVSMVNLQMKKVENNSKDNFYNCEKSLEEIRAGLENLTAETIQSTYTDVLSKYVLYSGMEDAARNAKIQNQVLTNLKAKLGLIPDIQTRCKSYLSGTPDNYKVTIGSITPEDSTTFTNFLIFKSVKVQYTFDNYTTSVTSDLKITLPSFTFTTTDDTISYSMQQPYEGYAIVADGAITSSNTTSIASSKDIITGNIYSGDDILVKDIGLAQLHELTLNGKYIVARGDIIAEDTATLTIGNNIKPIVLADNIFTNTTSSYPASSHKVTSLIVNAICLLKDDLALNGRNSNAEFNGAYIGYTGTHTAQGSAIMINGSGSSLDLSHVSALVLAGRADVTVEDSILKGITTDPNINIMTGESLAFKSNQRAYLLPGDYIFLGHATPKIPALHNPITQKDLLSGTPSVDMTTTAASDKVICKNYVSASPYQYKIAAKQMATSSSPILRYYYLNFESGMKADQYLVNYMNQYPTVLQVMDAFTIGSVKIPAVSKIVSVGNVMSYDLTHYPTAPVRINPGKSSDTITFKTDNELDTWMKALSFNDIDFDTNPQDSVLHNKNIGNLPDLYFNMTHSLTPTTTSIQYQESDKVVASTVLRNGIVQVINSLSKGYTPKSPGFTYYGSLEGNTWNSTDPNAKAIVIINGDATIAANSCFNGFFIASGNVTIGDHAVINGIVIAAGNGISTGPTSRAGDVSIQNDVRVYGRIIAEGSVSIKENSIIDCNTNTTLGTGLSVNDFLKNIFDADGQILWKLFINPEVSVNIAEGGTSSDMVNINNLVTYENWRMNE